MISTAIKYAIAGKAFENVWFNVDEKLNSSKVKSCHFRRPNACTLLRWTFRLSDATREEFCDILREIDLAVWKVLYAERPRIVLSSCCHRLLKSSVQES